jgi:hypothetical protein
VNLFQSFNCSNFFYREIIFKTSVSKKETSDTNNNDSTTVDNADHKQIEINEESNTYNKSQNIIKKFMKQYCLFFMHEYEGYLLKFTDLLTSFMKFFQILNFRKKLQ